MTMQPSQGVSFLAKFCFLVAYLIKQPLPAMGIRRQHGSLPDIQRLFCCNPRTRGTLSGMHQNRLRRRPCSRSSARNSCCTKSSLVNFVCGARMCSTRNSNSGAINGFDHFWRFVRSRFRGTRHNISTNQNCACNHKRSFSGISLMLLEKP